MKNKNFYITTAIPYVNAQPHLGHCLEYCQADVLARYYRIRGKKVFFLTGSDENSLKNVQSAEKASLGVKAFVDKQVEAFIKILQDLEISNDDFIRTTEKRHILGAQKLWQACQRDIYKKKYKGLYCVGCEEFKKEKDLKNGKCPEHPNQKLEIIEEENYFFALSKYEKTLYQILKNDEYQIFPKERKKEALSFINQGLEDFSISRSYKRAKGWGIPVPGDEAQIMYVWFDALANYLTGVGYGWDEKKFQENWPADIHIVGKGILKFHAIYWPAMLLSAGLPLPRKLFVHSYLTVGGQKMSKSLGNVIEPQSLINTYSEEVLRYFLLACLPSSKDGDFSENLLKERYNNDLADGIGNLVSRTLTMLEKYYNGKIPFINLNDFDFIPPQLGIKNFRIFFEEIWPVYFEYLENFSFDKAFDIINKIVQISNRYIDFAKPWELFKINRKKELDAVLYNLVGALRSISVLVYPFMPQTANLIRIQFGFKKINEKKFNFEKEMEWNQKYNNKIQKNKILFPKIKD